MKITIKKLKELSACREAIKAYENHGKEYELSALIRKMIRDKYQLDWANWLIVRCMDYKDYVAYAVYAAEQVIDVFEKKYPNDDRPRNAIEAAKRCIDSPTKKNKASASAAASDAYSAASDAYSDAYSAAYAASRAAMKIKILKYGLKLISERGR